MADNRVPVKQRLQQALDLRGVKPADLERATGIPKSSISYYLSGVNEPRQDRIYLISKALNINEAWLMGYDVSMERDERQKKSDVAVDITRRLGSDEEFLNITKRNLSDNEFFELSKMLYKLDSDQIASVRNMLGAFSK